MAKKGGPQSLQMDVNTDEEWDFLLQKVGLVVVDIYADWFGPCMGMLGNLKKIKLETGSDYLHLAVAKADTITALERFRNRSEPTWMFIGTGHLLRVYFGANAPELMRIIGAELEKEIKAINGERERQSIPFEELTPDEKAKIAEVDAKKEIERAKEEKDLAERQERTKRCNMERIARETVHLSLVVYFPQSIVEPSETVKKRTCQAAYKMMALYDTVGVAIIDQIDVLINRDILNEMFYGSHMPPLPEPFLKVVEERECIVSLIQDASLVKRQREADDEPEIQPEVSEVSVSERLGIIENKLSKIAFGQSDDPLNPLPNSVAKMFPIETDEGTLPGLWTPTNFLTKAAALKELFPNIIENLGVPEEKLPPPSYVMIFEASKAREVLETAEQFASDIVRIAYFDGTEPGTAQRVANTVYELERMGKYIVQSSKMVVALEKKHSDPMVVLAQLGPIYISTDVKMGTKEVETFFPPRVDVEEIPDPFGPEPPEDLPEGVSRDPDGNLVLEEFVEDENGETKMIRKVIQWAPGNEPEEEEGEEEEEEEEGEEEDGTAPEPDAEPAQ